MTVTTPKVEPDLRTALDQLPKPNGKPETTVTIHLPAGDGSRGPRRPTVTVDLEFHRGSVITLGGQGQPAWIYHGPIALDPTIPTTDRTPAGIARWIQLQLGPRCAAVEVEQIEGGEVTVKVAALIESAPPAPA